MTTYLLFNIWPVILVRRLLGNFRLLPTNTYNIGCGILPLGMKDFCMEMCTQYLACILGLSKIILGTQKFKKLIFLKLNQTHLSYHETLITYIHTLFLHEKVMEVIHLILLTSQSHHSVRLGPYSCLSTTFTATGMPWASKNPKKYFTNKIVEFLL